MRYGRIMETKTINLRDLPGDVVRKAKVCAALRGISLKNFVVEAIEKLIADVGREAGPSVAFLMMPQRRRSKPRRQRR